MINKGKVLIHTLGIVIGIDVGGSTTKIVGMKESKMISPLMVKADDPKASIYGAFGKFLDDNGLRLSDIDRIMVTGVGASALEDDIYGIRADKVDEFRAIGRGGLYLSGLEKAIIVSMGTGTAIISADGKNASHICGTGVGGGTVLGLSGKMLNIRDFDSIVQTANGGSLEHVDLFVDDLTKGEIPTLPAGTTASNFGRMDDLATKNDIAMGIINMVFQTIGVIAVLSARLENTTKIVLAGTLTDMPYTTEIFGRLEPLYGVEFMLPAQAEFTTSAGAALCAD
ncbi:MAG: type II pantothenate kinase [Clostridiales bacterium]|nr:type II pantothenate kinase [Clostridiales bacterium]